MNIKPTVQPEKALVVSAANTAPASSATASKSTALSGLEKEIEAMRKGDRNAPCKYFSLANELVCLSIGIF